mmetsp:Transcript_51493/g.126420  ORF Transcript_51493/g.126420 Transcript_51493/m.126420 type:complete len:157 (-) Transcript_51493:91-561(-)
MGDKAKAIKRLQKEVKQFQTDDELKWCTVKPVDDDLFNLVVTFKGPEETPYEKGTFQVSVKVPEKYPFKAPTFVFITKMYHPNIMRADGAICTDILGDGWSPQTKIHDVLKVIKTLLITPNPDNPLEGDIAAQFSSNRAAFEKTAREHVKKHASGK